MKRVLVVDDEVCVRKLVRQVLKRWESDVDIEEAEDGLQALHCLHRKTFDLIISDIQMPKLDGVTLLDKIRKTEYICDLPVLMLTGAAGENEIVAAHSKGATSYLIKPFNVADLLEALHACTDWDMRTQAADSMK